MSKQGYEQAPTAPLPTAPPPPYAADPPFNPHVQAAASPPYHYQPAPVVHETRQQAPYPTQAQPVYPQAVHLPTENTVVVGVPVLVGPQSMRTTCPNCRSSIQTRTVKQNKGIAHLFCLGLFFIGCCLCSCIPYCLDSMKEVHHTCPKCKAHLGTYRT